MLVIYLKRIIIPAIKPEHLFMSLFILYNEKFNNSFKFLIHSFFLSTHPEIIDIHLKFNTLIIYIYL